MCFSNLNDYITLKAEEWSGGPGTCWSAWADRPKLLLGNLSQQHGPHPATITASPSAPTSYNGGSDRHTATLREGGSSQEHETAVPRDRGRGTHDQSSSRGTANLQAKRPKFRYCFYCDSEDHWIGRCSAVNEMTEGQKEQWLNDKGLCRKCGQHHRNGCRLKTGCTVCKENHLTVFHEIN